MKNKNKRSFLEVFLETITTSASRALGPNFGYRGDMGISFEIFTGYRTKLEDRVHHLAAYLTAGVVRPFYHISGKSRRDLK